MSGGARIGLVVAMVVAIVVLFVVLSPGGDDEPSTSGTTATQTSGGASTAATGATATTVAPPADREPAFQTIRVVGAKPVGGIKKITVKKGDRARIAVSSPDTTEEIHLHGYDLKRDLAAGGSVRFSFDADAEGIFEIELEDSGTQIGELTVEP